MKITERQAKEIQFALYYARNCSHGTDGHNRLLLLAMLANKAGISLASDNVTLHGVEIANVSEPTITKVQP